MQPEPVNGHTKAGTAGGTLLVLLLNIGTAEILNTAILAAVGAAVSFTVSLLLRWLLKRLTRK
ncbi:MAG: hypothetical protein JWP81_2473 [Ferruginibacter sp.]|nr:hypothetical protein [Ferruginibacter sp.]